MSEAEVQKKWGTQSLRSGGATVAARKVSFRLFQQHGAWHTASSAHRYILDPTETRLSGRPGRRDSAAYFITGDAHGRPIPHFSKILDLEHDYDFYHVVLNEIVFTVLPVVLRGTALALYTEAALSHPVDGRYILRRLRYEVEGVPDSDTDRFWEKMRATIIDENTDPALQLTAIRTLGDKHARLNVDYSEAKRVKDLWHILATSAKSSPFVTPLYVNIIRDLRSGTSFSFSTLCLRIRTVWREEKAFATPAVSTAPPESDGGWKKPPTFNAVSYDRKPPATPSSWTMNASPNLAQGYLKLLRPKEPFPAQLEAHPCVGVVLTF
ncbi:hypothetical protein CYMTET_7380 [Cymbomonas tetramitiformis]|uniref:Uncharacterized protein n=1 Tax=Cymbomonas tetramitiformis TaxID=36881 RepID=A0AAE0GX28_9CHLO|nr:hypothetical protein CYMTET_7380 [Cymbomonas tetramitiformis]